MFVILELRYPRTCGTVLITSCMIITVVMMVNIDSLLNYNSLLNRVSAHPDMG